MVTKVKLIDSKIKKENQTDYQKNGSPMVYLNKIS